MKLQQNTNTVVRSGSFEESNYKIEASAKAFTILSDGLYADAIKAIVRELSTNAYDSHVAAGHPKKPFLLHLPNRFESTFFVRDYGTGLSHEDCMNLYTTYFGSNKTDSNDAVGCLGLGSKSPFAYTDSFVVTSFFNGTKSVYNSYKNEHDEPVFALMHQNDTSEENGMKVEFTVDEDDIEEFHQKAQEIYNHFKIKPVDSEGNSYKIEEEDEFAIEGSNWGILHKPNGNRYYNTLQAYAIMGQVAYPIDEDHFHEYGDDVRSLIQSSIYIHFDIGELDITPSREALKYNEYTKRAIKESAECILLEMKEVVEENFDACETIHEARIKYYKMKDSSHVLNRVVSIFDKAEVQWKDQPLWKDAYLWLDIEEESPLTGHVRQIYRDNWKSTIQCEDQRRVRFDHSKDMIFIYDDLKRGGIGRSKHYIKGKVGTDKYSREQNKYVGYLFTGCEKQDVIDFLQCKESDLVLTSTLESPTKSNYSYTTEKRTSICVWNYDMRRWDDVSHNMSEGGLYVEIKRYDIVGLDGHRSYRNADSLVEAMENLGYDFEHKDEEGETCKPVIFGIKSQELKKKRFNQNENWFNVLDLANDFYDKLEKEQEEWRMDWNFWDNAVGSETKNMIKIYESFDEAPEVLSNFVEESQAHSERRPVIEKMARLCYWLDRKSQNYNNLNSEVYKTKEELEEANRWPKMYQSILDAYPMLNLYLEEKGSWGVLEDFQVEAVVEYIKLIERTNKIDRLLSK